MSIGTDFKSVQIEGLEVALSQVFLLTPSQKTLALVFDDDKKIILNFKTDDKNTKARFDGYPSEDQKSYILDYYNLANQLGEGSIGGQEIYSTSSDKFYFSMWCSTNADNSRVVTVTVTKGVK